MQKNKWNNDYCGGHFTHAMNTNDLFLNDFFRK